MIGFVTLGTNDLEKASEFYDALFSEIGGKRFMTGERYNGWAKDEKSPRLMVIKPFDKKEATAGNGSMAGILVADKDEVQKMYDKALKLGATSEGEPGPRGDGTFYGAYIRDLDGNKLTFFFMDM